MSGAAAGTVPVLGWVEALRDCAPAMRLRIVGRGMDAAGGPSRISRVLTKGSESEER